MTPQEQAQAVVSAIDSWAVPGRVYTSVLAKEAAAAIRAAVDLVLPEERNLCDRSYQRMIKRAQFLAIASELEAHTND